MKKTLASINTFIKCYVSSKQLKSLDEKVIDNYLSEFKDNIIVESNKKISGYEWLSSLLSHATITFSPGRIFFGKPYCDEKNGLTYKDQIVLHFILNTENKRLWVWYEGVWSHLVNDYGMTDQEIRYTIEAFFKNHLMYNDLLAYYD
jgi:hypothetical protein